MNREKRIFIAILTSYLAGLLVGMSKYEFSVQLWIGTIAVVIVIVGVMTVYAQN